MQQPPQISQENAELRVSQAMIGRVRIWNTNRREKKAGFFLLLICLVKHQGCTLHSAHKMTAPCNRGPGVVTQQHTMLEKGARREKPKEASVAFELNITCNVARLLLFTTKNYS